MLDRICNLYYTNGNPIYYGKLSNYVKNLSIQRDTISDRHATAPGFENNGMSFLRFVLAHADVPYMQSFDTDLERYSQHLIYQQENLSRLLDTVSAGFKRKNLFIDPRSNSHEILVPVTPTNKLKYYPFDQGWDVWKNVRPLRLVYIDTDELSFKTYQDRVMFLKQHPKFAVFTLDPVMLSLQYARYVSVTSEEDRLPIPFYLHRYVFNAGILRDLQNTWLIKQYKNTFDGVFTNTKGKVQDSSLYTGVGLTYMSAIDDVIALKDRIASGTIKTATVLESLILASSNASRYYRILDKTTQTYMGTNPYSWIDYLRQKLWVDLLISILNVYPDTLEKRNFYKSLKVDINLATIEKPYNYITNPDVKALIKNDLDTLLILSQTNY